MSLTKIDLTDFEQIIASAKEFTLLCFENHSETHSISEGAIEEISQHIDKLQTFVVAEHSLAFFQTKFRFWGTPLYILLNKDKEIGRLLGAITIVEMFNFLEENINN